MHAASVNPEPGSNSPSKNRGPKALALSLFDSKSLSPSSVVKVLNRLLTVHRAAGALTSGGTGLSASPRRPQLGRVNFWVGGVTAIVTLACHELQAQRRIHLIPSGWDL